MCTASLLRCTQTKLVDEQIAGPPQGGREVHTAPIPSTHGGLPLTAMHPQHTGAVRCHSSHVRLSVLPAHHPPRWCDRPWHRIAGLARVLDGQIWREQCWFRDWKYRPADRICGDSDERGKGCP